MKPIKPNECYIKTARQLNLPIEYVQLIVDEYYAELKHKMSDFKINNINITSIARIKVKETKLFKKINKTKAMINSLSKHRISNIEVLEIYEKDLEKYLAMLQLIKEEKNRKYIMRKIRRNYLNEKHKNNPLHVSNYRDLEEQRKNSRRNKK